MREKYLKFERKISLYLKKRSITILRYSIGVIFLWYGLLKMLGISPAEELVYRATHWLGVHNFVIFLGVWEVIIALCLFIKRFERIGLWLLFLHFPGTFLPIFLSAQDVFTVIPYGLTLEGQYVFKNLIFIAAALVLVGSLYNNRRPPVQE